MNIREEINLWADKNDKPVLLWLLDRYNYYSSWKFVTSCTMKRYGKLSYQVHRVWKPTTEGKILFDHPR